jgi:hypothetical protein
MEGVVSPVLQRYEAPEFAINVAEAFAQKTNGSLVDIVAEGGAVKMVMEELADDVPAVAVQV